MSQYSYGTIDPTVTSGTDLASDLTAAEAAKLTMHSGATRPGYAATGTMWLNTTANPNEIAYYDGTNDLTLFSIDTANHLVRANMATVDPESTIASAATVDLGSVDTMRVAISGITSITSFGSKANALKFVRFTGAMTIAYNATTLITPTGQNILAQAGDTAIIISDGSGNWTIWAYTSVGSNSDVGKMFDYAGFTLPANHLWNNGAAVSRTTYATLMNAITVSTVCTTNASTTLGSVPTDYTQAGIVGAKVEGPGIPTGAYITAVGASTITISAAATTSVGGTAIRIFPWGNGDGATTFTLPDKSGRVSVGRDGMGGAAISGRVRNGLLAQPSTNLAAAGGEDMHTLTLAQVPTGQFTFNDAQHSHGYSRLNTTHWGSQGSDTNNYETTAGSDVTSASYSGCSITDHAGGGAHNNVQPSVVCNSIIRYQ